LKFHTPIIIRANIRKDTSRNESAFTLL